MPRRRNRRTRRRTLPNVLRYDYVAQFAATSKEVQVQDVGLNGINRPCRILGGSFTFTVVGHTRCPAVQVVVWGPAKEALTISAPSSIGVSPRRITFRVPRGTDYSSFAPTDSLMSINIPMYYDGTITVTGWLTVQHAPHKQVSKVTVTEELSLTGLSLDEEFDLPTA